MALAETMMEKAPWNMMMKKMVSSIRLGGSVDVNCMRLVETFLARHTFHYVQPHHGTLYLRTKHFVTILFTHNKSVLIKYIKFSTDSTNLQ